MLNLTHNKTITTMATDKVYDRIMKTLGDLIPPDLAPREALWQVRPRKGTDPAVYAIKHSYMELIAKVAGVEYDVTLEHFDPVTMSCVVLCNARSPAGSISTYGEARYEFNCKAPYPVAMAEKRAVDRAVLKLIGLHGLVYSESEINRDKDGKITDI